MSGGTAGWWTRGRTGSCAVTSDGLRVLIGERPDEGQDMPVTLVTNWTAALMR